MDEPLSVQPYCITGRATTVVPAIGSTQDNANEMDMVCKIYHPEVQQRHEGLTIQVIYEIAKGMKQQRIRMKRAPSEVMVVACSDIFQSFISTETCQGLQLSVFEA